jgi:arylsulfatase A-like enzyme
MREPAILVSPGRVPRGRVCSEVGAMMDVFPTILDLAGIEPPAGLTLDGRSVLSMASGRSGSPHDRVFWAYNGQTAVREGRWKLVLNGKLDFTRAQPDAVHLSDIVTDPGERTNLADREPETVARLSAAIREWERSLA